MRCQYTERGNCHSLRREEDGCEAGQHKLAITFVQRSFAESDERTRTVALEGGFKNTARQNLESIYKVTHKNSLEGLDQMIAKAKEDLTQKKPAVTAPQPK